MSKTDDMLWFANKFLFILLVAKMSLFYVLTYSMKINCILKEEQPDVSRPFFVVTGIMFGLRVSCRCTGAAAVIYNLIMYLTS